MVSTLQTAGAGQHVLLSGDMQTQAHEIGHRRVQDAELHRAFLVGKSKAIRRLQ